MKLSTYCDLLIQWLEEKRQQYYQLDGYMLGLSGGIDSAVCAHLLAKTGSPVHILMLPASVSSEQDLRDAEQVLQDTGLTGQTISIEPLYQLALTMLQSALHPAPERQQVLHGNLMARIRMLMLFTTAQSHRAIVVGTDNAAEWHTGYFTKFGDGAADVVPLIHLRKEQVYELAKYLGVHRRLIEKAPSAGLWTGQTDESEMGVSYAELDAFLRGEAVSEIAQERISFWHERSHHKRTLPLAPPLPH
ncbi:MAG: NAD(+) synthase [Cardiobacteriaceae bacterium]|nr:NAD(+) synthase [Cardiobacteriaceae bacterium]